MNILTQILAIGDFQKNPMQYAIWGTGAIFLLVILYYILKKLRKDYHPNSGDNDFAAGKMTIESLAEIYSKGLISKEEYLALKSTLTGEKKPVVSKLDADTSAEAVPDKQIDSDDHTKQSCDNSQENENSENID